MKKAAGTGKVLIDRSQVARVIFSAAESMGISDRKRIEELTSQVIERLERPQMLPGMEHLAPKNYKPKHITSEFEILSVIKEFLGEDSAEERQLRTEKEEPAMTEKTKVTADIELSQNAVQVLERRYLKKEG